ncbi:MAG: Smr/MutS family protein [Desulfuromonadales bacterium]|jgi:DNA-nicking Smr family endonuclease
MAKKKPARRKNPPTKFNNSPFKNLQGLSAFESSLQARDDAPDRQASCRQPAEPHSEENEFTREMAGLGVTPLGERTAPLPGQERGHEQVRHQGTEAPEDAEAVFQEALGSMDMVFKDDEVPSDAARRALPRRRKQLQQGQIEPQAELDLHGLNLEEAITKIDFFLQNASHHGWQVVLVITGRGLHSAGEPVLRRAVEKVFNQRRKDILEWCVAPRRFGGEGALVVFLRAPEAG